MSNNKSSSSKQVGRLKSGRRDDEQRGRLAPQPDWSWREAQQILIEQADSGQSIPLFAEQRKLTASRLYKWKSKLSLLGVPIESSLVSDTEQGRLASILDAQLDGKEPGERFVLEYIKRAIKGPELMWRLFDIHRKPSTVLCVVRWIPSREDAKPYSLVELELTQPMLRWRDFSTLEAAKSAFEQRGGVPADKMLTVTPALLRVEVRDQTEQAQPIPTPISPSSVPAPRITIRMPSGVRIQIPGDAPEALIRTVLRSMGASSC